jgi:ribosomal protein S18 acetylase RimI-like enzyme
MGSAITHDRRMTDYQVRRVRADEWRQLREIRLESLQDTPIGFGEWYADAAAKPDEDWQERAVKAAESTETALFGALDEDGRFVGIAGVFPRSRADWAPGAGSGAPADASGPSVYVIYSVYVTPDHRGPKRGVVSLLFDTVIAWAREVAGADVITLSVHERNDRAHAFYRRYGFVDTGETMSYILDPSASLLEMRYEG